MRSDRRTLACKPASPRVTVGALAAVTDRAGSGRTSMGSPTVTVGIPNVTGTWMPGTLMFCASILTSLLRADQRDDATAAPGQTLRADFIPARRLVLVSARGQGLCDSRTILSRRPSRVVC